MRCCLCRGAPAITEQMPRASVRHYPDRSEGGGRRWKIPFQLYRGMYQGVIGFLSRLTRSQYDTVETVSAPDITNLVSPLTVTSLLSIGGFAGTFMPLPSRTTSKDYQNPPEELVDRLIGCPSEKTIEINFNLASKTLWSRFVTTTLNTTNNQSRIYIVPDEESPSSPNTTSP
jgi:hypothetical protein